MTSPNTTKQRRYDLDWLRVFAIGVVFIFHSGRFFDTDDWHVKNAATYLGVQIRNEVLAEIIRCPCRGADHDRRSLTCLSVQQLSRR